MGRPCAAHVRLMCSAADVPTLRSMWPTAEFDRRCREFDQFGQNVAQSRPNLGLDFPPNLTAFGQKMPDLPKFDVDKSRPSVCVCVCQNFPNSAEIGKAWRKVGRTDLARVRPNSTETSEMLPIFGRFGPDSAQSHLAELDQIRPRSAEVGDRRTKFRPKLANCGPCWSKSGQIWSKHVNVGPNMG